MKKYTLDYTQVAKAAALLLEVRNSIKEERYEEAENTVLSVRDILLTFCNQSNMVEDEDTYDGWYRSIEVENIINIFLMNS